MVPFCTFGGSFWTELNYVLAWAWSSYQAGSDQLPAKQAPKHAMPELCTTNAADTSVCSELEMPSVLHLQLTTQVSFVFLSKSGSFLCICGLETASWCRLRSQKSAIQLYQYVRDVCSWRLVNHDPPIGAGNVVAIESFSLPMLLQARKISGVPSAEFGSLLNVSQHRTVNHSVNFEDPVTGVHTNHIESYWNRVKHEFKRIKGCSRTMLDQWRI